MTVPWMKAVDLLAKVVPLLAPSVIGAVSERLSLKRDAGQATGEVEHELQAVRRDLHQLLTKLDRLHADVLMLQTRVRAAMMIGVLAALLAAAALAVAAFK